VKSTEPPHPTSSRHLCLSHLTRNTLPPRWKPSPLTCSTAAAAVVSAEKQIGGGGARPPLQPARRLVSILLRDARRWLVWRAWGEAEPGERGQGRGRAELEEGAQARTTCSTASTPPCCIQSEGEHTLDLIRKCISMLHILCEINLLVLMLT
jgi:hypothetical protein